MAQPQRPPLPDPGTIQSKGFTLRGALAYVEQTYGAEGKARLLEAASPEVREVLAAPLLSSSWYPFSVQVGLYVTADRAFGKGDLAVCRNIGRFTAEFELSTIHRLTLKFATIALWMRNAARMWGQYYTAGAMAAEDLGGSGGRLLVTGFNPIHRAFCEDLSGWIERTIEMSGKEGVRVTHPRCLLDGHEACVYQAAWRS